MNKYLLVSILFSVFLLGGCAEKLQVKYVWPPPPEEPRLEWVGNYYSEAELPKSDTMKALGKIVGEQQVFSMVSPFGIVSDNAGRVFVSDIHAYNVHIFDFNDSTLKQLTGGGTFKRPVGLALDANNNLYVADAGKGMVMVYAPDLRPKFTFGKEEMEKPSYIAINEALQRIYVSDGLAHVISVFDMQGKHLFNFGGKGTVDGYFFGPQGLAINPEGNLYVADLYNARIQYFDADGQFLGKFGSRGDQFTQFESPKDIDIDSEGNIYVVDARAARLSVHNSEGEVLLTLGSGPTSSSLGFGSPRSIFIDKNDRIYIADISNKRFSVWQYYSKKYLEKFPYTEKDKESLILYMEKRNANQDNN